MKQEHYAFHNAFEIMKVRISVIKLTIENSLPMKYFRLTF